MTSDHVPAASYVAALSVLCCKRRTVAARYTAENWQPNTKVFDQGYIWDLEWA